MEQSPIVISHLRHSYGKRRIYQDLSLTFEQGKIYGLLGKNGVGKTTMIKILMGFLTPQGGECRIFGDPAHALRNETRERVGLLFERHLAYDFFSIAQVERFMSRFYKVWKRDRFYGLVDVLGLPYTHKIAHMSEGQRSQVVLGLMLAQDPELLILDDYSMGLDAGYRRLFVDYLRENLRDGKHTVVLTSHVIQDMNRFVDEIVFLRRGGHTMSTSMEAFMRDFHCYKLHGSHVSAEGAQVLQDFAWRKKPIPAGGCLTNVETHRHDYEIFSFHSAAEVAAELATLGVNCDPAQLEPTVMDMEDAFVGYTGRF